jgi:transcriptional regulator with XRE-family HTH domain
MQLPENNFDFKKLRKDAGLTLREVESLTGISNPYLSQLENKKVNNPSYEVVKTLVNLYENAGSKRNSH